MANKVVSRKGYQSRFDHKYISQLEEVKSKIDKKISLAKLNKEYGSDRMKQFKSDLGILNKNYVKQLVNNNYERSSRNK